MALAPTPPDRLPPPAALPAVVALAVAGPALLAWNEPPSATFYNQALALAGWCLVVIVLARWLPARDLLYRGGLSQLWWALGLLLAAAVLSPVWAALPWGLALSAAGVLVVAGVVASAGAAASQARRSAVVFAPIAWTLVLAGLASAAIAVVQLHAPGLADGTVVARSTVPDRAVGNLRQANHLASLLLWSAVATAWLADRWLRRRQTDPAFAPTAFQATRPLDDVPARARRRPDRTTVVVAFAAAAALAPLVGGVVLSGSRTGLLGIGLLALWGGVDRRLTTPVRLLLMATPLMAVAAHGLHGAFAAAPGFPGVGARSGSDISSSRFAIWRNTLELIEQNPWVGVGFGEFNFAWTLTPFPDRPVAFFDHTHNLPLQLLVELGVPLGLAVLGLLGWALWRALGQARRHEGEMGLTVRAAFVMVLLMGLHSLLEYPLWYAHFLLPTAFCLGLCLAGQERRSVALRPDEAHRHPVRTSLMSALIALLVVAGAVWDYQRVVQIFKPSPGAPPLAERIAEGRQSWFFAHHADYAAVTTAPRPSAYMPAFDRAAHHLLDARLMRAWAQALDETNQVDRSRHLAQRLAEFRHPQAADFFAVCAQPPSGDATGAGVASPVAGAPAADEVRATASDATGAASAAAVRAPPASAAASWVDMAASFPTPVPPQALPRGPPAPPADPAFAPPAAAAPPFQCLKPARVLSYQDFR